MKTPRFMHEYAKYICKKAEGLHDKECKNLTAEDAEKIVNYYISGMIPVSVAMEELSRIDRETDELLSNGK